MGPQWGGGTSLGQGPGSQGHRKWLKEPVGRLAPKCQWLEPQAHPAVDTQKTSRNGPCGGGADTPRLGDSAGAGRLWDQALPSLPVSRRPRVGLGPRPHSEKAPVQARGHPPRSRLTPAASPAPTRFPEPCQESALSVARCSPQTNPKQPHHPRRSCVKSHAGGQPPHQAGWPASWAPGHQDARPAQQEILGGREEACPVVPTQEYPTAQDSPNRAASNPQESAGLGRAGVTALATGPQREAWTQDTEKHRLCTQWTARA